MKSKTPLLKALILTLTLSIPALALANNIALKVAVVADSTGSRGIIEGNYHASIKKITRYHRDGSSYNNNMNLCVAYLKAGNTIKSESSCTAAIESVEVIKSQSKKNRYLQSLSYNNRAISRYKSSDISGALADLKTAVFIDANKITLSNLRAVEQSVYESAIDHPAITAD